MFRFKKSIPVSYNRQGYIYFRSLLYREMGKKAKEQIERACMESGEHWKAVLEFVTTDQTATSICMKHHISQSTLERAVRTYYTSFPRKL